MESHEGITVVGLDSSARFTLEEQILQFLHDTVSRGGQPPVWMLSIVFKVDVCLAAIRQAISRGGQKVKMRTPSEFLSTTETIRFAPAPLPGRFGKLARIALYGLHRFDRMPGPLLAAGKR